MSMERFVNGLKWAAAAAGGLLGGFLGGFDSLLTALCVFVAADFVTGVIAACAEGALSSRVSFAGIGKKICIFLLVGLAATIDTHLLTGGTAVRTAAISFYLTGEGISLLENCVRMGLPVPPKIGAVLAQMEKK